MTTDRAAPDETGMSRRRTAAQGRRRAGYTERRAEIVAAAADVFRARGYRGTSLADIAEAVGTDRASLYYYVSSKEELLDEVVTDVVKANLVVAEQIRDSDAGAPHKLRTLVTQLMCSYAEHYPFLYVYLQENLAHVAAPRQAWATEMRRVNRRYEAAIEAIVQQGIEEGSLRAVSSPRVMAYGLIGMVSWTGGSCRSARRWTPRPSGSPTPSCCSTAWWSDPRSAREHPAPRRGPCRRAARRRPALQHRGRAARAGAPRGRHPDPGSEGRDRRGP